MNDARFDDSEGGQRPSDPILHWPRRRETIEAVVHATARKVAQRRRRATLTVVAAASAVALALFSFQTQPWSNSAGSATIVSAPTRQVLEDGSIVELNHGAKIVAHFTSDVRRVDLRRGEAHFQVAHNAHRPFVVLARGVEVRAVGTAFSVELARSAVEVLVTEGRVSVESPAAPPSAPRAPALVDAGSHAVVDTDASAATAPRVATVAPAALQQRLAWRVPRLEFSGTPLAEALTLFNQHSPLRVILGDASLGTVRISGTLRADNAAALVKLLSAQFGIVAETTAGSQDLILRRGG